MRIGAAPRLPTKYRRTLEDRIELGVVSVVDWVFLLITGLIAWHGLTYRDDDGENDIGHLLFGSIALLFFVRVLFVDILKLI